MIALIDYGGGNVGSVLKAIRYLGCPAEAVARPEVQAPNRQRVFSMAVTAPDDLAAGVWDFGAPRCASWAMADQHSPISPTASAMGARVRSVRIRRPPVDEGEP